MKTPIYLYCIPRYNIDNNDDDPLSEQVVEEMRHADAIKDIRYSI